MCLYKTHRFPKISRKPIKCYKIFNVWYGILLTPYMRIPCQIGNTIKAKNCWIKGIFKGELKGEVVHAFRNKDLAKNKCLIGRCVYLCEIPPYTPYWYGEKSEIAASKMKIIKKLYLE